MFPDDDVVGDLDKVVDFRAFLNPRPTEPGAVDGDVRADFHVVVDLDDASLGNFHVATAGEFEAEAVAPQDRATVDDDATPEDAARADGDAGRDLAVRADAGPVADVAVGAEHGIRADARAVLDDDEGLDGDVFAEKDIAPDDGGRMHARGEMRGLRGEYFQHPGEGQRGIFHANRDRGNRLVEIERHEGRRGARGFELGQVFGVAEKRAVPFAGIGEGGRAGNGFRSVGRRNKLAAHEGGQFLNRYGHER